jgi:predicted small lipoprotein YifL
MSLISALPTAKKLILLGFISVFMLGILAGCGKKPSDVEAPVGASPSSYPGTYPDPATDPQP